MEEKNDQYPVAQERIEKQKELFLEQMKKTPIVQIACEKVGIGRTTVYRWRKEDSVFAQALHEAIDVGTNLINDLAESKLIKLIQEGEMGSIRFWLQNHHDGYANRLKISTEPSQELSDEDKQTLERAYQHLGLIETSATTYEEPIPGPENNGADPQQQESSTGSHE